MAIGSGPDNLERPPSDSGDVERSVTDNLCYSVRLLRPFVRVLAKYGVFAGTSVEELLPIDPDERIPVTVAHELLQIPIELTGDADIGLKAGRSVSLGDVGVLDYAISTASTVREALELAARYIHLVNDALDIRLELDGHRVLIRFNSQVELPRAAADFMVSSFYSAHFVHRLSGLPHLECCFSHAAPQDTSEYERTFTTASVRFGAPYCGFVFDKADLERRLENSNPDLHAVIRGYVETGRAEPRNIDSLTDKVVGLAKNFLDATTESAEVNVHGLIRKHLALLIAELPKAERLTDKVRNLLATELSRGHPTAARIAVRLHMSPRTLGRKLEKEGTTFTAILEDLRQRLARQFVGGQEIGLSEVAFLLGFSDVSVFHRAFRRWTGQTPLEYRRAQQSIRS